MRVLLLALVHVAVTACATSRPSPSTPATASPAPSPIPEPTANPTASPTTTPTATAAPPEPSTTPAGSPTGWTLVWSDEFDAPAGTPPDPKVWGYDLGDGSANGNVGWGNRELQYYTEDPANAATDGDSNLVITARDAEGGLACYYGACRFTSARLLTKDRYEVEFGRVETRAKVPVGFGVWPAFWMLGTDIGAVGWPKSGEIDVLEHVGRLPKRVFGTIHGPGYSGNDGFGSTHDFDRPVADDFHTFAVEWSPGRIVWFVDDIEYHRATPADVAPSAWAFDHPFFLLLNLAVGGNFGGPVGPETTFPQEFVVDYVRIYRQGAT